MNIKLKITNTWAITITIFTLSLLLQIDQSISCLAKSRQSSSSSTSFSSNSNSNSHSNINSQFSISTNQNNQESRSQSHSEFNFPQKTTWETTEQPEIQPTIEAPKLNHFHIQILRSHQNESKPGQGSLRNTVTVQSLAISHSNYFDSDSESNNLIPVRNSSLNSNSNSNSTTDDDDDTNRQKRQLFREDIPLHRPLSGNHYARHHGFPHPGRFNDNSGQQGQRLPPITNSGPGPGPVIGSIGHNQIDLQSYGEQPVVIQTHTVDDDVKVINHGNSQESLEHEPGYAPGHIEGHPPGHIEGYPPGQIQGHNHPQIPIPGQEVVHRYPVEVSQIIQLDHDNGHEHNHNHGLNPGQNLYQVAPPSNEPHAPPQIHPNQDPIRHPHEHETKPHHPPDLVVKEPNGNEENNYEQEVNVNVDAHAHEIAQAHDNAHDHEHPHQHGLYTSGEYSPGSIGGGGGGAYAHGFGYAQTHPSPGDSELNKVPLIYHIPYRGAYKFAQFLKTWPQILLSKMYGSGFGGSAGAAAVIGVQHGHILAHTHAQQPKPSFPIWPFFRRYRSKIKHNHYHHF